jgi:predicted dehydrogenase
MRKEEPAMKTTYRLGVIGFAHMHVNTLIDGFAKLPSVQWAGCADTVPGVPSRCAKKDTRIANLKRAREITGIPRVYDDYRQLLEKEKPDIVIFCPENSSHGEVAEAIAAAGAHLVTEKPMAASLGEALRMARAVRAAGVELMVNWPTTWSPAVRAVEGLLEQGAIGQVWELKWRNGASMGPLAYGTGADEVTDAEKGVEWWHRSAAGGGALLDYCCYGACLSRWLLDQKAVAASCLKANLASPYGDAEDNAVIIVRFERAMAILEGTWTTWNTGVPVGPVIHGTRGTLVVDHAVDPRTGKDAPAVKIYTSRAHSHDPDRIVFGDPLPAGRAGPAEEFVHHLETGDPLHPTLQLDQNLEAMAILDAGIRSAASGKQELVGDAAWTIG